MGRHAALVDGLLQGHVHLFAPKSNLSDLVMDEVPQNSRSFPILSIDRKLAATRILMDRDQGSPI